jgi:hypothetical protein
MHEAPALLHRRRLHTAPRVAERLAEALEAGVDAAEGITLSCGGALAAPSEMVAHAPACVGAGDDGKLAFAPSNNLACRRTVVESIRFDESYPSAAGEDGEWCARVIAAGYVLASRRTPVSCITKTRVS